MPVYIEAEGMVPLAFSMIETSPLAVSNGPLSGQSEDRRKPDLEGPFDQVRPLATCVPPRTSAQPARPPSAALVIRLTFPPRSQMLACAPIVLHDLLSCVMPLRKRVARHRAAWRGCLLNCSRSEQEAQEAPE